MWAHTGSGHFSWTLPVSVIQESLLSRITSLIFEFTVSCSISKVSTSPCSLCTITSSTTEEFSTAFKDTPLYSTEELASTLCPDDFISSSNGTCSGILDS
ncbi:hypothetical protein ILYODFUR_021774, partial [Ilyodon furcidens]